MSDIYTEKYKKILSSKCFIFGVERSTGGAPILHIGVLSQKIPNFFNHDGCVVLYSDYLKMSLPYYRLKIDLDTSYVTIVTTVNEKAEESIRQLDIPKVSTLLHRKDLLSQVRARILKQLRERLFKERLDIKNSAAPDEKKNENLMRLEDDFEQWYKTETETEKMSGHARVVKSEIEYNFNHEMQSGWVQGFVSMLLNNLQFRLNQEWGPEVMRSTIPTNVHQESATKQLTVPVKYLQEGFLALDENTGNYKFKFRDNLYKSDCIEEIKYIFNNIGSKYVTEKTYVDGEEKVIKLQNLWCLAGLWDIFT